MKKRILLIALCVLLLAALLPGEAARADGGLSFIAINDSLPPELINVMVTYGGVTYMPYWFYTNYGFGISYTYFSGGATAYLFNANRHVFFDLSTGRSYDSYDNEYPASAIVWGGTVYLPLGFVANHFGGFTYRTIGSNDYGSILRISTGSEVLTDEEFFRAAESAMRRYYRSYQPTATPEPAQPTPTPTEKPVRTGDTVRLGLDGLPAAETLELLRRQEIRACFFLSEAELRENPDLVRQIACEGHTLGVFVPEGDVRTCRAAAALLWETARVRTVLTALPEDAVLAEGVAAFPSARAAAETRDGQEMVVSVMEKLEMRAGDQTLIFPACADNAAALRLLLRELRELDFSVTAVRETDSGGTPILP